MGVTSYTCSVSVLAFKIHDQLMMGIWVGSRRICSMVVKFRGGINSCLPGDPVRWNTGHKRDTYLTHTLGRSHQDRVATADILDGTTKVLAL
jgi:hypothetical protein